MTRDRQVQRLYCAYPSCRATKRAERASSMQPQPCCGVFQFHVGSAVRSSTPSPLSTIHRHDGPSPYRCVGASCLGPAVHATAKLWHLHPRPDTTPGSLPRCAPRPPGRWRGRLPHAHAPVPATVVLRLTAPLVRSLCGAAGRHGLCRPDPLQHGDVCPQRRPLLRPFQLGRAGAVRHRQDKRPCDVQPEEAEHNPVVCQA